MRKCLLPLVFSASLSSCGSATAGMLQVTEYKTNSSSKNYKHMLILSAGSIPFRIFTENLYTPLSTILDTKGVKSTFIYLGSSKIQIDENLKKVRSSSDYDAYMWLSEADTSKVMYYRDEFLPVNFNPGTMKQKLRVVLYENINSSEPCWGALLHFDLNLAKQNTYKKVSAEIIKFFSEARNCPYIL